MPSKKAKVYLSYNGSLDAPGMADIAKRLYDSISSIGMEPWIDFRNKGEKENIDEILNSSDLVLVIMDRHRLNKIQTVEVKKALEIQSQKGKENYKIVPLIASEKNVSPFAIPENLRYLRSLSLNLEEGYDFNEQIRDVARIVKEMIYGETQNPTPPLNLEYVRAAHHSSVTSSDIVIAWDPELVTPDEYAELVEALGDLVRAEGGAGIERIRSKGFGVPCESGVPR